MIKEYFTDGLIGIAIILSLFRTDLVGINNLINYPEVQDIILGQTAAYLPANYHHIHSSLGTHINPKHLDFDNTAFNAWFQNINNLPLFRESRANDIEAFLVSGSQENVDGEQYASDQSRSAFSESNSVSRTSSSFPLESASSFIEELVSVVPGSSQVTSVNETSTVDESNEGVNQKDSVDSWLLNGTFTGSNLTKEDLKLIDILYQQDVDLGVGKEVFDPQYREELERERELEFIKNQEWQKTQLLAREKEEQKQREQKDKWLLKNFRRDGETGEWVHVWNGAGESSSRPLSLPDVDNSRTDEEFISLEAALEFLENLGGREESINTPSITNEVQQEQQQQQPQLMHQDSFNENWNGLVDYLNLTNEKFNESLNINNSVIPPLADDINIPFSLDPDLQTEYLIQNVTLPLLDVSADLSTLTQPEELNSSMPFQSVDMNTTIDFDIGDLNFFSNFTSLQNTSTESIGLAEGDEFLQNIQDTGSDILMNKTLAENMDAIQLLEDNLNFTDMGSIHMLEDNLTFAADSRSSSPLTGFNDTFDGLEGATGGSDFGHSYGDTNDQFTKVSRLSESSSDSGFAYQGGFTSPSSSASSSYAGSPSGSHSGLNSSASSNDTEHDPHGTRSVVNHHVAHNHTYNTLPGQTPREVKKYAQKIPSRKGPQSRDQRRAEELKIPFTVDDIVDSSVEAFNEMLTAHKLNEAQLTLIRDIRRRGKNKVAAQNCRKRKVSIIYNLSDETTELQKMRDRLLAERAAMDRERSKLKEKCSHLYSHIFQSLRDERGAPYDPNFYSLQQSSDGSVFLVPRNLTGINSKNGTSSAAAKNIATPKKRKFLDE
ncbi:unnamed protein product [Candidula unifasciata]|uniref:BZIP domain-containing protein n=1 Tax=Candidula unifasciata TaxID=100452 RepID=A0A8S3YI08_9EUPU|nr:unnamed protein product [Candidula unifasciata]